MAWSVELAESAERELGKLDAQHRKRILKFLHGRVAKLDDPRSLGEVLHGSRLGSSGNTASAITGSSRRSKTTDWWCWFSAWDIAKKRVAKALRRVLIFGCPSPRGF